MFEEIRIENLGVIEHATVELGPGLTVVTGETGAGKTMVLTGVSLLLGAKTDAAVVRQGATNAVVEGRLLTAPTGAIAERVADAGASLDGDALVIVRSVSAESGRSRAYLGGRSVPQAVLTELGADLVTVHGQSDQLRLRSSAHQREALDEFAGPDLRGVLDDYRALYRRRQELSARLSELTTSAVERAQEAERLAFALDEIAAIAPVPGEDEELSAELERLSNAEDLRTAAATALALLAGSDSPDTDGRDVSGQVESARRALEHAGAHDNLLTELGHRVGELGTLVGDVAAELAAYLGRLDADPARLEAVHERRAALTGLCRKYGPAVDDVLAWSEQAAARHAELVGDVDRTAELRAELTTVTADLEDVALSLTACRKDAAVRLAAAVTAELAGLAMTGAALVVEVRELADFGSSGRDDVEFLLIPHAGSPARPLAKGASGGELSRVMLALEVALADGSRRVQAENLGQPRTFIFDEVDAGVGGKAATEVGLRLALLARTAQVIVVTHLAQVAAFADRHLVVSKAAGSATTDVRVVSGRDRLRELARMLSGQDSQAAFEHAAELRDVARSRLIFEDDPS